MTWRYATHTHTVIASRALWRFGGNSDVHFHAVPCIALCMLCSTVAAISSGSYHSTTLQLCMHRDGLLAAYCCDFHDTVWAACQPLLPFHYMCFLCSWLLTTCRFALICWSGLLLLLFLLMAISTQQQQHNRRESR